MKIILWFNCSKRVKAFCVQVMEAWNSIFLENPTCSFTRPVSDFSICFRFGSDLEPYIEFPFNAKYFRCVKSTYLCVQQHNSVHSVGHLDFHSGRVLSHRHVQSCIPPNYGGHRLGKSSIPFHSLKQKSNIIKSNRLHYIESTQYFTFYRIL